MPMMSDLIESFLLDQRDEGLTAVLSDALVTTGSLIHGGNEWLATPDGEVLIRWDQLWYNPDEELARRLGLPLAVNTPIPR